MSFLAMSSVADKRSTYNVMYVPFSTHSTVSGVSFSKNLSSALSPLIVAFQVQCPEIDFLTGVPFTLGEAGWTHDGVVELRARIFVPL